MGKRKKPKPLPETQIDRLYRRDGGVCWICGEQGPSIMFNKDHLIPKSLGGSDGMWNLRISHPRCNVRRDRMAPPLSIVLMYCTTAGMEHRAKRMYYRAYPHLKKNAISGRKTAPDPRQTLKVPKFQVAPVIPGPPGHPCFPSMVCPRCSSWCGTCKACWCLATESDHDVLKIRSSKVEMGVASPS